MVKQDIEEMANSQQTATVAALCQLKISFKTVDTVRGTTKGMPAAGVLQPGDVITAVDGKPVTACGADAATLIKARKPGAPVRLTVLRHGHTEQVRLNTVSLQGQPVVGVQLVQSLRVPVPGVDLGREHRRAQRGPDVRARRSSTRSPRTT